MIDINVYSLNVSSDESSYCYSFSAEIAETQNYILLTPGKEVDLVFYNVTYRCIIDEKSRSIEFNNRKYNINGRAITAKLGEGWSEPITKTWGAIQASAVVNELCAAVGISYEYTAHDWLIPAGVLSATNEYPIDVIRKIAVTCGAIIQTKPDGTLVIQPKYKVSPKKIFDFTPDVIIENPNDIIQLSESYRVNPKYNEVLVMNMQESSDSYSIELLQPDPPLTTVIHSSGHCEVAIHVFPFSDTPIELFTSSDTVSMTYLERVVEEILEEQIEIVNGEASTSRLIKKLIGTPVYIDNHLGDISYEGNRIKTKIKGQSILILSYKTEYHKYRLHTSTLSRPFQVYTTEKE